MKKIFRKSNIFSFLLGAIIFGGIGTVFAYTILAKDVSYTPKNKTWEIDNVKDAIDDLYTNSKKGYTALFSGSTAISITPVNVPVLYANNNFVSNSNNQITIKEAGQYQIIASISHSPYHDTYTSFAHIYLNNVEIKDDNAKASTENNFMAYVILNKTITLSKDDVIYSTMSSDGNKDGLSGATIVLIKL